jgi:hypothetical protein
MGKAMILSAKATVLRPAPTAEDAAFEYFVNRRLCGAFAPRPPVERWSPDQRERFEAELERLEAS